MGSDKSDRDRRDFPKLRGSSNYRTWSTRMENKLLYKDLWDVTFQESPHTPPPDVIHEGTSKIVSNPDAALWHTYNSSVREWEILGRKARERIEDECIPAIQDFVKTFTTGRDAWFALRARFETTGWSFRYSIVQDLTLTTLDSCDDSVESYIGKFLNLTNRLTEMGDPLPEWLSASLLVGNLNERFRNRVHFLLVSNRPPNITTIINAINEEDRLQKILEPKSAMAVRTTKGKLSNSKKSKAKKNIHPPCLTCQQTNHSEDHCFVKHPEPTKAKAKAAAEDAKANTAGEGSKTAAEVTVCQSSTLSSTEAMF